MAQSTRAAASARAAQMRAEEARKDRRRKNLIAAVVVVIVVIIAVVLGAVIANRPSGAGSAAGSGASALQKLTSIPAATLDDAAAPSPQQAPAKLDGATEIKVDGKPQVLYVGAEYCPFCAVERWALIGALSRFGTFSGITETTSSSTDVHPDTPTFSFVNAKYQSDYVSLKTVETQDREGKPLQTLEGDAAALFQKYNTGGSIPWINYGGTNATTGATVDSTAFDGKTYDQIIEGILDPNSDLGKTVLPAVNVITAQICQQNGGKPSNVCTAAGVQSASVLLKR